MEDPSHPSQVERKSVSNQSAIGQWWIVVGAWLGGLAVLFGAFGAHGLESWLPEAYPDEVQKRLDWWGTAVQYHLPHSLAILFCGLLLRWGAGPGTRVAAILFTAGVLLFSGSLYGLTLTTYSWLGMVAPLGGTALILGWGCLAVSNWPTQGSGESAKDHPDNRDSSAPKQF